jgi:hypothetical protein
MPGAAIVFRDVVEGEDPVRAFRTEAFLMPWQEAGGAVAPQRLVVDLHRFGEHRRGNVRAVVEQPQQLLGHDIADRGVHVLSPRRLQEIAFGTAALELFSPLRSNASNIEDEQTTYTRHTNRAGILPRTTTYAFRKLF